MQGRFKYKLDTEEYDSTSPNDHVSDVFWVLDFDVVKNAQTNCCELQNPSIAPHVSSPATAWPEGEAATALSAEIKRIERHPAWNVCQKGMKVTLTYTYAHMSDSYDFNVGAALVGTLEAGLTWGDNITHDQGDDNISITNFFELWPTDDCEDWYAERRSDPEVSYVQDDEYSTTERYTTRQDSWADAEYDMHSNSW